MSELHTSGLVLSVFARVCVGGGGGGGGDGGVGLCEGILCLTSPGRPADIGLQLGKGKACYPCSR